MSTVTIEAHHLMELAASAPMLARFSILQRIVTELNQAANCTTCGGAKQSPVRISEQTIVEVKRGLENSLRGNPEHQAALKSRLGATAIRIKHPAADRSTSSTYSC